MGDLRKKKSYRMARLWLRGWISCVFQAIETIFYIIKKFIIRWDGPKMSRHIYFKIPKRIAASSSSSARKKFPPREAAAFPVLLLLGSEKKPRKFPRPCEYIFGRPVSPERKRKCVAIAGSPEVLHTHSVCPFYSYW